MAGIRSRLFISKLKVKQPLQVVSFALGSGRAPDNPHSGLRRGFRWLSHRKSVTLSLGTPLCPYPITYRRAYGFVLMDCFKKPSNSAVWTRGGCALSEVGPSSYRSQQLSDTRVYEPQIRAHLGTTALQGPSRLATSRCTGVPRSQGTASS